MYAQHASQLPGAVMLGATDEALRAVEAYTLACTTGAPLAYQTAAGMLANALRHVLAHGAMPRRRPVAQAGGPMGSAVVIWARPIRGAWAWGYDGGEFQFSGFVSRAECIANAIDAHRGTSVHLLPGEEASELYQPSADAPKASRARKPKSAAEDLAAPLPGIPKAKAAVAAFTCTWADGSETHVAGVVYHGGKPETRWAAAFQAADRLRRARIRTAYASELADVSDLVGRFERGPCGVMRESPTWQELVRLRPLPALAFITEDGGAAFEAPEGSSYGAGDAERAAALEAQVCAPRLPWLQADLERLGARILGTSEHGVSYMLATAGGLKDRLASNGHPSWRRHRRAEVEEAFAVDQPRAGLEVARVGAGCDGLEPRDLIGQLVVIDPAGLAVAAERAGAAAAEAAEVVRLAKVQQQAVKDADPQGYHLGEDWSAAYALVQEADEAHARARTDAQVIKSDGQLLARFAADRDRGLIQWTVHRVPGGRQVRLQRSDGQSLVIRSALIPCLRFAAPALSLAA